MSKSLNSLEFSKKEIILSSWNIMKPQLSLMVIIILIFFSLNILVSIVQEKFLGEITIQTIMFIVSASLFQIGLNLGFLRICLNIINNQEVGLSTLFGSFHMLISYVLATMLYLLALILVASPGIVLLIIAATTSDAGPLSTISTINSWLTILGITTSIVPIFYLSVRLQFYDYFLIDEECGVLESLINSAAISKGHVLELFIFGAALSIIILISIIPLGVGLFISIPLATMATTYLYIKLK